MASTSGTNHPAESTRDRVGESNAYICGVKQAFIKKNQEFKSLKACSYQGR